MNYCRKCGNTLKEGQKFCSKCGTEFQFFSENAEKIREEAKKVSDNDIETVQQYETMPSKHGQKGKHANKQQGKSVKGKPAKGKVILILVLVALAVIAGLALVLWLHISKNNGSKIIKELEAGNYDKAVEYYQENYDEVTDEMLENLKTRLQTVEASYVAGTVTYENAMKEIEAVSKMKIKKLESTIESVTLSIEELYASRTAFEEGNALFESGEYEKAIAEYQKVIESDSNYATAIDGIIEAGIQKAENEAADGEFITAITTLNAVLEYSADDTELTAMIAAYTEEYADKIVAEAGEKLDANNFSGSRQIINVALTELGGNNAALEAYLDTIAEAESTYKEQVIAEALQKAEAYAAEEDYDNALSTLKTALSSYPGNSELTAAQTEYKEAKENAEVAAAIAEADSYVAEKNYDAALSVIASAMLTYPSNSTLSEKYSEIEGKKPVALTDFAFANSKNAEIIEDVEYDTVGNVYWGNTVKLGGWYENTAYITIYLGKEYKTLTGVIACQNKTSEKGVGVLYIKSDLEENVLRYLSVSRTMAPTEVSVDVSSVEWLTIEVDKDSGEYFYFLLSDFYLEK